MSYTRLRYHFVFCTKNRRPWITSEVERVIHRATIEEANEFGAHLIVMNGIDDHQHVIIAVPPTIAICKAAGRMKAVSCRTVRRELKMPEFQWQAGYSCHTLNARDFGTACRYVRDQKQHHSRQDLIEEYEHFDE